MPRWLLLASLAIGVGCTAGSDDDHAVDDDSGGVPPSDDDTSDDDDAVDDDTGDDDSGDDDTSDDDDDTADDDTGDDDSAAVFDCATIPPDPLSETIIAGATGYHGLAFDGAGHIIGSDNSALIRSDYQGNWSLFVPGQGMLEQMATLPNGDLLISSAEDGALRRVTAGGTVTTIAPDIWAYGVVIGPDGLIYAANWDRIYRVDPTTGAAASWATLPYGEAPHAIDFSVDFTRMYVGTVNNNIGTVYSLELDANLEPTGPATIFAIDVGFGYHDAVGVDCCGNLYVADYYAKQLFRISPAGAIDRYVDWSPDATGYGHGLVWGDGVGGWRTDAIYLPLPYGNNQVVEIVIGVPDRLFPGTVLNAP